MMSYDDAFDRWWGRFTRVTSFALGCGIIGYITVKGTDPPYLIAAAIGLIGPAFAKTLENLITWLAAAKGEITAAKTPEDKERR